MTGMYDRMSRLPHSVPTFRDDGPERLYTLTGGRSRAADPAFDLVTFVVAVSEPVPGMASEHAAILRMCAAPTPVVEIAWGLDMPVSIVKILLGDLHAAGRITARTPLHHDRPTHGEPPLPTRHQHHQSEAVPEQAQLPDAELLKQVLVGLHRL
jgi:hypothetical protein